MHNHMILLDVRRHVLAGQESTDSQHQPVSVAHMERTRRTRGCSISNSKNLSPMKERRLLAPGLKEPEEERE